MRSCDHLHDYRIIALYSVPFRDRSEFLFDTAPTLSPTTTMRLPPQPGSPSLSSKFIHQLSLSEGRLVVSVVDPGQSGLSPLQILLVDLKSKASQWVDSKHMRVRRPYSSHQRLPYSLSSQPYSDVWVKVYAHNEHLIFLGPARHSIILRVYALPTALHPTSPGEPLDLGSMLSQYEQPLRHDSQFQDIIRVSAPSAASISALVICSFHDTSPRVGQVTRFPLPSRGRAPRLPGATRYFNMPSHVSAQLALVGPAGRAVWVEHDWETQKKRVVRFQMRKDGWEGQGVSDAVSALLPTDAALPFLPDTAHSLAFDEVSGRVCIGLFNGEIYVMDFV